MGIDNYKSVARSVRIGSGGKSLIVMGAGGVGTTAPNVVDTTKDVSLKMGAKAVDIKTALWGTDNLLPHNIAADVKTTTVIASALRKKTKIHYGQGLTIVKPSDDGKLTEVHTGSAYDFFKSNKINKKLLAHITDLEWFQISFVEYVLDNSFNAIAKVNIVSAPYCRLSIQEADKDENEFDYFRSKYAVYSKQWANDEVNEETSELLFVVDPEWSVDYVKDYCKKNKIAKFVRPVMLYMPETDYYPEPYWNSARTSGWTEIAQLIPKIKKAIVQNSMTLKYVVKIPHNYFEKKYPNLGLADRDRAMNEDLDALDEYLADFENTGKSLVTYYDIDRHTGKQFGAWEIDVIDNKIKDGVMNLDGASANVEILMAIGLSPTLVGTGLSGNSLLSSSGSDLREAFNIAVADAAVDREVSLEFVRFIADFNGFDVAEEYKFKNTILTTVDKQPAGIEKKI